MANKRVRILHLAIMKVVKIGRFYRQRFLLAEAHLHLQGTMWAWGCWSLCLGEVDAWAGRCLSLSQRCAAFLPHHGHGHTVCYI